MSKTPQADTTELSLFVSFLQSRDEGAVSVCKDHPIICRMSLSLRGSASIKAWLWQQSLAKNPPPLHNLLLLLSPLLQFVPQALLLGI